MSNSSRHRVTISFIKSIVWIWGTMLPLKSFSLDTPVEVIHDLGVQSINGDGVPVDLVKGRYYIHQSALQGYPLGQFHLGVLFYTGEGGAQNTACAKWWLGKAAQTSGEVHDMAKDALSEIREDAAVLSPKPIVEAVDEVLCLKLPDVYQTEMPINLTQEQSQLFTPKVNLDQLQNAIISVPKLNAVSKKWMQYPFHTNITVTPHLKYVLRWSTEIYHKTRVSLSKKWVLLSQQIQDNHKKAEEIIAYKVRAQQIRPLDIVRNPPEEPEEITITILLSPEQEAELAKNTLAQENPLVFTEELAVSEPTIKTSDINKSKMAFNTKLVGLTETLTTLPNNKIFQSHSAVKAKQVAIKTTEVAKNTTVTDKPMAITTPAYNLGGDPRTASSRHYTLQIGSASHSAGLYEQARRHKLSNYLVYETVRNGRQWYVLVYGEYPNMSSAKRALKTLPSAIQRDKPWIRSLQHVQSELH